MTDYELTELAVIPFMSQGQDHFEESDEALALVECDSDGHYVVYGRRDVPTDYIYWSPHDPDVTDVERGRILDAVNGQSATAVMGRKTDNAAITDWLNEYYDDNGQKEATGNASYIDIASSSSFLGQPTGKELFNDLGVVPIKVMHSSELSNTVTFPYENGYRVWFASVDVE